MLPIRDLNPTRVFPILTILIIAVNAYVFFLIQPQSEPDSTIFFYEQAAVACELTTGQPLDFQEIVEGQCETRNLGRQEFPDKNVWLAAVVSMFLHGSLAHILFNMWSFWIFGNNVEDAFGKAGFIGMYLAAGVAATVGFVALNPNSTVPLVGASGAIAGVMGAYLVLFPRHSVLTLFGWFLIPIPAMFFLGFWFLSQFAISGAETNVAWEAHVFGFLFGVVLTFPLRGRLLSRLGPEQPPPMNYRRFRSY